MLEAARERAIGRGVADPQTRQRHGDLVDTLTEMEAVIRLLVIGKQGEDGDSLGEHIGSIWKTWCAPCTARFWSHRPNSKNPSA